MPLTSPVRGIAVLTKGELFLLLSLLDVAI
jgi:hypothetical protein